MTRPTPATPRPSPGWMRCSIYFNADTAKLLRNGAGEAGEADARLGNLSGRVSHLMRLADAMAREAMPVLSTNEWGAIFDAQLSLAHAYDMAPASVIRGLWINLQDGAPEFDEKWSLDAVALARRLHAMPLAAQAAVFEVAQAFWATFDGKSVRLPAAIVTLGGRITPARIESRSEHGAIVTVEFVDGVCCIEAPASSERRSITNDAENVIAALMAWASEAGMIGEPPEWAWPVIYCDTTGQWDELQVSGGAFTGFRNLGGAKQRTRAIDRVLALWGGR